MKSFLLLNILSITWLVTVSGSLDKIEKPTRYCLSDDDNPYLLFAQKTSYEYLRENAGRTSKCQPIQMWIIARHGTRHPQNDEIDNMKLAIKLKEDIIKRYESNERPIGDALCEKDYQLIKNWTWNKIMEEDLDGLTEQGWKDLVGIAERYQKRYPELLGNYSREDYYFRHSNKNRTKSSCYAFIDGLFGKDAHKNVAIEKPLIEDILTELYDVCPAWKKDVDDSPDRKIQCRIFSTSPEFKKMEIAIAKRLGLNFELNSTYIEGIFNNCAYDKSKYLERVSPWCSVFSKSDLNLIDYYHDIEAYYESGFGHPYNRKMGNPVVAHLLEIFEKTVANGFAKPKTVALFSHDNVIDMMFNVMNYSIDQEPLMGTNFHDLLVYRKYRTSLRTPFAANVVAVLHDCRDLESERYQVEFFINERPMIIKGCDFGLCSWNFLKNTFSFVKESNVDFCWE